MKTKTSSRIKWLAIARDALIRSGESPSWADIVIEQTTGDSRDLEEDDKNWAFELLNRIESEENLETVECKTETKSARRKTW